MSPDGILDVRPRTTGEILDDAWRLYFADAPQLLVMHGLFAVPAFAILLLTLTLPPSRGVEGFAWAFLAACAVPLTGIGSGACQEWFRRRSEGNPLRVKDCLGAALRRGLYHAAARAAVLSAVLLGSACLVMPGMTLWVASSTVHALLAEVRGHPFAELRELGREAKFDPVKSAVVTLSRLPLLLLAFINLYLFVEIGLWAGDSLCGLDLALPGTVLSLSNPAFDTALLLGCWLLLAPYFEASNFLLHLDTRTRQEGLDLLFRVRRAFPLPDRQTAGTLAAIVLGLFATLTPARSAEPTLEAARAARLGVEAIMDEVKEADPYPGGRRWEQRLNELARRLERSGDGDARHYPWFAAALEGFRDRSRDGALLVLSGLQRRLALLEETLTLQRQGPPGRAAGERPPIPTEDLKRLVRPRGGDLDGDGGEAENKAEKAKEGAKRKEVPRDDPVEGEGQQPAGGRKGPGIITPTAPGAGLSAVAWWVLGGLLLAILIAALVLYFSSRRNGAPAKPRKETTAESEQPEASPLLPHEQPASAWWREADDFARQGRHLDALRAVYLAVLSLLHRQQLIRFETTRTNGEYVEQVRLAAQAPRDLAEPFGRLTALFEMKWYGDRSCNPDEFRAGRELGVQIERLAPST
jgi:hypothetical protein